MNAPAPRRTISDRLAAHPTLHVLAAASAAALFVAAVFMIRGVSPADEHLGGTFQRAGWEIVDWNIHYWNYWQSGESLSSGGEVFHSSFEFYPYGLATGDVHGDPLLRLLGGLLNLVFSPDTTFFLVSFLALWSNALGGYLLGFQLTRSHLPAMVMGLFLALCGMVTWSVNTGNLEYGFLVWICLHLLFLFRLFESWRYRDAALCGLFAALAVWSNLAMVFHLLMLDAILLGLRWRAVASHGRVLAVGLVTAALLLAPAAASMLNSGKMTKPALQSQDIDIGLDSEALEWAGDLKVAKANSHFLDTYLPWISGPDLADTHVPISILLLALAGLVLAGARSREWWGIALLFFILALGPLLRHKGFGGDGGFRLPFYYLHQYVPFYDQFRFPHRIFAFSLLALGVAATLGLSRLAELMGKRRARWVILAMALVVAAEMLTSWKLDSSDKLPVDPVVAILADCSPAGGVIALPMDFGVMDSVHLRNQTVHGRPLMNGVFPRYLDKVIPVRVLIGENPLLRHLWRLQNNSMPEQMRSLAISFPEIEEGAPPALDAAAIRLSRSELRRRDIHYVLFHRTLRVAPGLSFEFPPDTDLERFLEETLGPPIAADDEIRLYRF